MFIIHFIYFPEQQTLLPPHILCVVFIFITCSFIEDNNTRQSNDFAVGVCGPVGVLVSVSVHELVPYLLLLLFAAAAAAATLLIFRCSFSVRFLCTRSVHSLTHSLSCLSMRFSAVREISIHIKQFVYNLSFVVHSSDESMSWLIGLDAKTKINITLKNYANIISSPPDSIYF